MTDTHNQKAVVAAAVVPVLVGVIVVKEAATCTHMGAAVAAAMFAAERCSNHLVEPVPQALLAMAGMIP